MRYVEWAYWLAGSHLSVSLFVRESVSEAVVSLGVLSALSLEFIHHLQGLSNTVLFLTTRKSFITQASMVPTGGIRVTTHQFTLRERSTWNDREIQLDPIKLSRPHLASPSSAKGSVVLFRQDSRQDFDSDEERVMIIERETYPSSK